MKFFIGVVKQNIKTYLQYNLSMMISILLQAIILLINIALFKSIYSYNGTADIKGYTLDQMIWYFTSAGFVKALTWNFVDGLISRRVMSGEMVMDLLKPVSFFRLQLANAVGQRVVGFIVEFIPGFAIMSLIYTPRFVTIASVLKFLLVVSFSFLLFYLVNYLVGMTAFAMKDNRSIGWMKMMVISFAGGAFIPLEFFPDWANRLLDYLPFKYMFYWPVQFFLNKESCQGFGVLLRVLGLQLVWVVLLYAAMRILWKLGIRKFCAAGG